MNQRDQMAELFVTILIARNPAWLDNIRTRLAAGETYEDWRKSFQATIDALPALQAVVAKKDAEPFLRQVWQISRDKAAKGKA